MNPKGSIDLKSKPQCMIHASFVYTAEKVVQKKGRLLRESDLVPLKDGAVVYDSRRVIWVGPTSKIPKKYFKIKVLDLENRRAIMPGLVDSHTHLVFAGSRSNEFASRCAGASYAEIASSGGGIQSTVRATRDASFEELLEGAIRRVKVAHAFGVRTLECKSGYGLQHDAELKCLRVVQSLKQQFPYMTFVSTYLGAHDVPRERSKKSYFDEMIHRTLPVIRKQNLAENVDVFIDDGYYSLGEGKKVLTAGKKLKFKLKVHADELTNTEASALGVKMGALSVDHLLKISRKGIQALANSRTVATLLPGTAFSLKVDFAPARALLDSGAQVALATDFNPGSCYSLNLPFMMHLGALYMKMNAAEVFAATTLNAATALGLKNKGAVLPGYDSDFVVLPYAQFEEMIYRLAW